MKRSVTVICFLMLLWPLACVDPYNIAASQYDELLVVDGFISNANRQHQVVLSKTSRINQKEFIPEQGAYVRIRDKAGPLITMVEDAAGIYKTPVMSGVVGNVYSLLITTSEGIEYTSEEVTLRATPPISQVHAEFLSSRPAGPAGIQISLDTEDPTNQTHYYRWEYEETYEIKTPYDSKFYWIGGNAVTDRGVPVNDCWASDTSKNILVETTIGLQSDKVTSFPIRFVLAESQAMVVKYSILIRQFALSEESYQFWKSLRKINEAQGSLFDIQPGEVHGNMSSITHPEKAVLGYFDASAVTQKRVFYTPDQFAGFVPPLYHSSCSDNNILKVLAADIGKFMLQYQNSLEILDIATDAPAGYLLLPKPCCNCTDQGTNIKPSFWF